MAMIFDIGIPRDEAVAIADFLASGGEADIPELGEDGAKVLDVVTTSRDDARLWRTVLGKFVEYKPELSGFRTPEGKFVWDADMLMGEDGQPTGRQGQVVEDLESIEAAYIIGTPV